MLILMYIVFFVIAGIVIGLVDKDRKFGLWIIVTISVLWGFVFGPWSIATFIELLIGYFIIHHKFFDKDRKTDFSEKSFTVLKDEGDKSNYDSEHTLVGLDEVTSLMLKQQRARLMQDYVPITDNPDEIDITWIRNVFRWLQLYSPRSVDSTSIPSLKTVQLGSVTLPELYPGNIREIPADLCRIRTLERLYLQFNEITKLPDEIGNLEKLEELKLGGNNLKDLPGSIGNLINLEILTIWNNDLVTLPPEIGLLRNLKGLSLWGNPIATLPDEITNLTQLKILELGSMPNLVLSPKQKIWVKNLAESGSDVWLDGPDSNSKSTETFVDSYEDGEIPF